jgi:hypothetical protein
MGSEGTAQAQAAANAQRFFQRRDGSLVGGRLVELVPGERVVLELPDGSVQSLAWTELLSGEPLNRQDEVRPLRITTNRPVDIDERASGSEEWRPLLSTATTTYRDGPEVQAWVRKRSELRIRGANVTHQTVRLPEDVGLRLEIHAGSRTRHIAGSTLLVAGGILAAGGVWMLFGSLLTAFANEPNTVSPPGWLSLSDQLKISGSVVFAGGVLGLAVGWGCLAHARTRVALTPLPGLAPPAAAAGLSLPTRGTEP